MNNNLQNISIRDIIAIVAHLGANTNYEDYKEKKERNLVLHLIPVHQKLSSTFKLKFDIKLLNLTKEQEFQLGMIVGILSNFTEHQLSFFLNEEEITALKTFGDQLYKLQHLL